MASEDESRRRSHRTSEKRTRHVPSRAANNAAISTPAVHSKRSKDLYALRAARHRYPEIPPEGGRKKMKYVGETVTRTAIVSTGEKESMRASQPERSHSTPRPRKHRSATQAETYEHPSDDDYVYGRPVRGEEDITHKAAITKESSNGGKSRKTAIGRENMSMGTRKLPRRRHTEPVRRRSSSADGIHPSTSSLGIQRHSITSQRNEYHPSMKRSMTQLAGAGTNTPEKMTATEQVRKPSLFSSMLRAVPPPSEKKVSCLTCGSDVRISQAAKLACSHRMCHACLRRIFTMSVTDPAHMPPKCCTSDHIPLKHVDRLFDQSFKKAWNRKFQEFTTRNRTYCPSRGCGEWIKPNHITLEHGRKVGKCKRCGTKVCCTCNNKMHTAKECPKDPDIKKFVEVAKEKGWQRCYNCSAMVELKEGCNHMTCRCTAEFCMVCGLKWKTCDCPWFNYEQVDAHLGNPVRYQEEMDRRREQEQRDEALARRMEILGLDDPEAAAVGTGNLFGHQLNQNFIQQAREALTANYQHAEQAARGLLNGLMTGRDIGAAGLGLLADQGTRQSRRGNARWDPAEDDAYESGAVGAPIRRATRRASIRRQHTVDEVPRPAV